MLKEMDSTNSAYNTHVINAAGHYTYLGGSLLNNEVREAINDAAGRWVNLFEFQRVASGKLSKITGSEGGIITSGAYSSLVIATEISIKIWKEKYNKIKKRPEILIQKSHITKYAEAFRVPGSELKIIDRSKSNSPLDDYVSDHIVAIAYVLTPKSLEFDLNECVLVGKKHGIPVIVDAAVVDPPVPGIKRLLKYSPSFIAVSGGKGFNGPSNSGILLFKKEFEERAINTAFPNYGIARGMKVGKEQMAGLLKAIEISASQDQNGIVQEWWDKCNLLKQKLSNVPNVECFILEKWDLNFPQPISRLVVRVDAPDGNEVAKYVFEKSKKCTPPIYLRNPSDSIAENNQLIIDPRGLTIEEIEEVATAIEKLISEYYTH